VKWRQDPTEEDSRIQLLRETSLKEKYWKAMLEVGSKYERHDGSHQSALLIVQRLLQKPVMMKRKPGWVREWLRLVEEQGTLKMAQEQELLKLAEGKKLTKAEERKSELSEEKKLQSKEQRSESGAEEPPHNMRDPQSKSMLAGFVLFLLAILLAVGVTIAWLQYDPEVTICTVFFWWVFALFLLPALIGYLGSLV
jgi:hypothetical protein